MHSTGPVVGFVSDNYGWAAMLLMMIFLSALSRYKKNSVKIKNLKYTKNLIDNLFQFDDFSSYGYSAKSGPT